MAINDHFYCNFFLNAKFWPGKSNIAQPPTLIKKNKQTNKQKTILFLTQNMGYI